MREELPKPDGELTADQVSLVEQLGPDEVLRIDNALLANTWEKWRKVAMVVGMTMMNLPRRVEGIPDIYYSQRVKKLVNDGLLESQGDLTCMRFSEVRRPEVEIERAGVDPSESD